MRILVTGVAGFIGNAIAKALLSRGYKVIGIDNLNSYYSVELKHLRLAKLQAEKNFTFYQLDICDFATYTISQIKERNEGEKMPIEIGERRSDDVIFKNGKWYHTQFHDVDLVIHMAAQAGVRYSLENPSAYIKSNIEGFLNILEFCRTSDKKPKLIYASSSSVYGANTKIPFSINDRVDKPLSLYAATKLADEHMAYAYNHLYGIDTIGLRFFTVYGEYGRPDMAPYKFTKNILQGKPINVYNNGNMSRDFTYIDDIVSGVLGAIPISGNQIYNLGNNKPTDLMHFISLIEQELGIKAQLNMLPMQKGEVQTTFADITETNHDLGFAPIMPIEHGVKKLVTWVKSHPDF